MKTLSLLLIVAAGCGTADPQSEDPQALRDNRDWRGSGNAHMCDSYTRPSVDQSQLNAISTARLGTAAETMTVGKSGTLAGVELSVSYCGWNDPKAHLKLQILDDQGVPLAEARISTLRLPQSCSAMPLDANRRGATYFDLTAACVKVTAGQVITLSLSTEGVKAGACDFETGCTSGRVGETCFEDADCASADLRAGMGYDTYLNGFASMDGDGYATYDLAFRTLIR